MVFSLLPVLENAIKSPLQTLRPRQSGVTLYSPVLSVRLLPLAAFNGSALNGRWTIRITNTKGEDALGFYSYSLTITDAVPEPSPFALLGSSLLSHPARRIPL